MEIICFIVHEHGQTGRLEFQLAVQKKKKCNFCAGTQKKNYLKKNNPDELLSGGQWIPWSIMDGVQSHSAAVFEASVI